MAVNEGIAFISLVVVLFFVFDLLLVDRFSDHAVIRELFYGDEMHAVLNLGHVVQH